MNLARYSKSIAALTTAALGWAAVVISSPSAAITAPEWLALGVGVATALGVYVVPNTPPPAPPKEGL